MRALSTLVFATALSVSGCGATPSRTADAPESAAPPLGAYVLPDATFVLHVHADALRKLGIVDAIQEGGDLHAVELSFFDDQPELARLGRCALAPEAVDELVVSGDPDKGDLLAVAASPRVDELFGCVAKALGAERTRRWGLDALELEHDAVAVLHHDRVLFGSRERVREALDHAPARAGASDVRSRLAGDSGSAVRLFMANGESRVRALGVAFDGDDESFLATLSLHMATTQEADRLADTLRRVLGAAHDDLHAKPSLDADERVLARVLGNMDVRRQTGGRVTVEAVAEGNARFQATALAALAGFAQGSATVLARTPIVDGARATVVDIAGRVAAYADAHRLGRFPSLPASAPALPAAVPSGAPTAITDADWSHATWRALDCHFAGDTWHSYAIETAPGRRSATVRAVSDFDGDGVRGTIAVTVSIDARGEVTIGDVVVNEPLE